MAVTALEINTRQPLAGGREFGSVGHYIQLDGTAHFAVDPAHPSITASPIFSSLRATVTVVFTFLRIFASSLPKTLGLATTACCLMCRTAATGWRWGRSTVSRDRSTQVRRPMQAMAL